MLHNGETKRVVQKLPRPGPEKVYNLEVFGQHVYLVSQDGLLVHNSRACVDWRLPSNAPGVYRIQDTIVYIFSENKDLPFILGPFWQVKNVIKTNGFSKKFRPDNWLEAHHVVNKNINLKLMGISEKNGIAISLPIKQHRKTLSYGSSAHYDSSSSIFEVLDMELNDVASIMQQLKILNNNINNVIINIEFMNFNLWGIL